MTDWKVERLATVASTMDEARRRAAAGAPDGTVVVAEEQTAARGTRGRIWHAPKGGLYLSLVLRDIPDARLLTLALGNAVADALEVAGAEPRLKWVNDVLVDGRKVAGILVEGQATGARLDFAVAGIGINVNGHAADFPPALAGASTTLEDILRCDSCIPDLEAVVLEAVDRWVSHLRRGETAAILDAVRKRDALRGARVRVEAEGKQVEGQADGIDEHGRLRVVTPAGPRHLDQGTVSLLP